MNQTIRKQIIKHAYLPTTLDELADLIQHYPSEIEDHLYEIQKSSRYRIIITPARCRSCGFEFRPKIRKPGKCPACKSTWIISPRFTITPL